MIEDRLRGLKLRVPVEGTAHQAGARLPTNSNACRDLGEQLALHLTGRVEHREIDMAALA